MYKDVGVHTSPDICISSYLHIHGGVYIHTYMYRKTHRFASPGNAGMFAGRGGGVV